MGFTVTSRSQLFPSITVKRTVPKNIQPGEEKFFEHEYKKTFPPVFLYHLKNVNVSPEGIVFRNFQVFAPALIDSAKKGGYRKYLLSNYLKRKKIKLSDNETYILAFDEWSHGYFHWMCDVLPRLMSISAQLNECVLLLPANYTSKYVLDSLKIFQIKKIRTIPLDSYFSVENLLMPGHIASITGNYYPEIMQLLREEFYKIYTSYTSDELTGNEKIYVSRKKDSYKHIINENEVVGLLEKYGFQEICFEDYSFQEQITLCKNAKYLISMHGANLVNMMLMPGGSHVLEFRKNDDKNNNAYYSLASVMNQNYYYQLCHYENKNYRHPNRFDLSVDIKKLEENVLQMLK